MTLGICLDKGIVRDIDDPISRYLPPFAKRIDLRHMSITVRHLLTMSSGIHFLGGVHYHCPMLEQMRRTRDWIAHIADVQMVAAPGMKFVYKEWDVILLSALIGRACGGLAWDVAREYLFAPLGIDTTPWLVQNTRTTGTASPLNYNADLQATPSIDKGDKMTALHMAKIGRLMLNNGIWEDQQIISPSYLRDSITQSPTNPHYGYLWWLSETGCHARGFGGQEINIHPAKKIVTVVQATVTPSSKMYPDIGENIVGKVK